MSFFAELLAGATSGLGKGIVDQADYNDKLEAQRALQEERQRDKLETQRRDQEFRQQLALERAAAQGGGSGGGGGLKDFNPVQAFESLYVQHGPDDPRTQRAYELIGTSSRAAQGQLDNVMGRILSQSGGYGEGAPTSADVTASMSTDGKDYTPQPPAAMERSKQLAFEGEKALQRLRAAMVDGGKNVDDFAKAETGFRRNDLGDAGVVSTLKGGGSMADAGDVFNRITNPAKQSDTAEEYVRLKEQELALKAEQLAAKNRAGADRLTFDQVRQLEKDALEYRKLAKEAGTTKGQKWLEKADELERRISQAQTPAAQPSTPSRPVISNNGRTASGKILSPKEAAQARGLPW